MVVVIQSQNGKKAGPRIDNASSRQAKEQLKYNVP